VFYDPSARFVTLGQARLLREAVPAFVSVVALFVNASRAQVQAVIDDVRPDLLQFHGDETPEFCRGFDRPFLRGVRVGAPYLDSPAKILAACQAYPDAAAWLFDSYSPGYGGSGLSFDPALLNDIRQSPASRPMILAGGLAVDTVSDVLRAIRPYAIDVSS